MDARPGLGRRLAQAGAGAAWYFAAGLAISVLVALVLSQTVDVRLATPLSAGDQQWSVERWDRPGASQVLSTRHWRSKWGPLQATGPPDTPTPGDRDTAWAAAQPDAAGDWLELSYPAAVVPRSVRIYESYNPGAVSRITAFKADGAEVEAWQGVDPTPPSAQSGTSVMPLAVPFSTKRIRIYIASEKVPGWNEIDAVALVGPDGRLQWAADARASSFYGDSGTASGSASSLTPSDLLPGWSGLDRLRPDRQDRRAGDEYRLEDARGWPMLALRSEKDLPASAAAVLSTTGGFLNSPVLYSAGAAPVAPPDLAAVPLHPIWSGLTIDALVFGAAMFLLRWLLTAPGGAMRELSRLRRGRCLACGYDLGYDFARGCPECGWRRDRITCPGQEQEARDSRFVA
jgi:hypothetical protein